MHQVRQTLAPNTGAEQLTPLLSNAAAFVLFVLILAVVAVLMRKTKARGLWVVAVFVFGAAALFTPLSSSSVSAVECDVTPTAIADQASLAYVPGGTVALSVLGNDTGEFDIASVDLDTELAGRQTSVTDTSGTWTVDDEGIVTFAPNGPGVFKRLYSVTDRTGKVVVAEITVTVIGEDIPPLATDNYMGYYPAVDEDSNLPSIIVSEPALVIADDTAYNGATLDAASVDLDPATPGIQHSLVFSDHRFDYDPATGAVLLTITDTSGMVYSHTPTLIVSYTVQDSNGLTSNEANVIFYDGTVNS